MNRRGGLGGDVYEWLPMLTDDYVSPSSSDFSFSRQSPRSAA